MDHFSNPDKPFLESLYAAQQIAFAPVVFQACRTMVKRGILAALGSNRDGLTIEEAAERTNISTYGIQVLLEVGVAAGVVRELSREGEPRRYQPTKTGECLAHDEMTRTNLDFVSDVCYRGMARLDEAVVTGAPAGLSDFGPWKTIYPALSSLPEPARTSWFRFDHFYSDAAASAALQLIETLAPRTLLDIGGNTGRWAQRCLAANPALRLTIVDLPEQIDLARRNPDLTGVRDRVSFLAIDWLGPEARLPANVQPDVIWMSQFLDCFSGAQAESILRRVRTAMTGSAKLVILEPLWDRQRYPAAAFSLVCTSTYFTAFANGHSRMFRYDELRRHIESVGLQIESEQHDVGVSHSLLVCSRRTE
jgi:hypothetical protein